ncbi:hypothetical protein EMIHUDRAFT_108883 [Emiliania huxleyi CCMP1516]|uniref:Uncharacterized protein n=2 Tax=Emiliania huxleyi TaxID=2903 RepID=A0A0D3KU98_EMIH1|nr:hypothetical protein EMIHUDRAFT_108883 [Emiliania huxleyi CCMP1516]EOD39333.1 hypothetical protein EMIHUDRAFT_108883 [Emiliania huxleyi CCMP1516]|eukprot:XP_005791762.1 hypothetical protein EMIHUDRAFT_108883 [Emiliania huxleyi CCMP1516]
MPLSPHASSFTVCHATAVWRTTDKRCICSPCQFLVVHLALVPHPPKGLPEDNHVGVVQTDAKHVAELLLESEKGLARKRVASAAADVASQQVAWQLLAWQLLASQLLASQLLASQLLASQLLASQLLASRRARRSS